MNSLTDKKHLEEALVRWELDVSRWEAAANDVLLDSVKLAVLLEQAPPPMRQHLVLQGFRAYRAARDALSTNLTVGEVWAEPRGSDHGSSNHMEVDAVLSRGGAASQGKDYRE